MGTFFDFSGLAPHGMCLLWRDDLFWALGGTDAAISAAYISIGMTILHFILRRKDMYLRWVALLFAAFIILCATSHATDVWTLWYADYGVQVIVKSVTAIVSLVTAVALWPLMPRALAMPSGAQLSAANQALTEEIHERRQVENSLRDTEEHLRKAHESLERKVEERTWQLQESEARVLRLNADLERRVEDRTAELTAANRELDSFAYAVSHDLRAPLRAMMGFSDALLQDFAGQMEDEAKDYLGEIVVASRHMGELIDGLLQLSRSTRGIRRHDLVDLSALATRLLQELAMLEPARSVTWQVAPGLVARGDPDMLEVVMRNLLGNAWKYTAAKLPAAIRVYAEQQDDQWFFCVSDNGAGFDMVHADKLFQPFQRLHRQDEFSGIGIGLATVERIVRRHGGRIIAEAAPDLGATFRFCLNSSDAQAEKETP